MRYLHLLLICFCWAAAYGAPHGHLQEMHTTPELFLVSRVAKSQPITFCATFSEQYKASLQKRNQDWKQEKDVFLLHINAALRAWTQGTASYIRQAGRAQEFADLLPLLDNAQFVQMKNCNLSAEPEMAPLFPEDQQGKKADLAFFLAPDYCGTLSNRVISFYFERLPFGPFICVYPDKHLSLLTPATDLRVKAMLRSDEDRALSAQSNAILHQTAAGKATDQTWPQLWKLDRFVSVDEGGLFSLLVHEIGHAFGLADEYTLKDIDPVYASLETHPGVMQRLFDRAGCSEADGLITLLDRQMGKSRTFTSFCQDGPLFTDGVEQVKETTPAQLITRGDTTLLYSLLPDSPKTKTVLAEIWEKTPSSQTLEVLEKARLNPQGASFYSRGRQRKTDQRVGDWGLLLNKDGAYTAVNIRYNTNGELESVRVIKSVDTKAAAARFTRMELLTRMNIARTEKKLKSLL